MSVHMDDVFISGNPDTFKNIKENIKERFNIQESGEVIKFLWVYYEWGCDVKSTYTKITIEKDVRKIVKG